MLIEPKEVIKRAVPEQNLNASLIKQIHVHAAQESHIRPRLGHDLMDKLEADHGSLTGVYKTLLQDYLMDALACYVMYEAEPHMAFKWTNSGIQNQDGRFSSTAITKDREYSRNAFKKMGDTHMRTAMRWLEDNKTSFSEYDSGDDIETSTRIRGNVVIPNRNK